MSNKYVGAGKFLYNLVKGKTNLSKTSPDITEPRQLKQTMEKIRSKFKKFAFKEAKTANERANIVRTKKSIERMNKLDELKKKRKEGIKASKETKKMIDTNQAEKIGGSVYHRNVPEKKAKGGRIGFKKGTGRSGVPAMDIKSTPAKKLSEKQKKIARLAGDPEKIDKPDFAKLRSKSKNKKVI